MRRTPDLGALRQIVDIRRVQSAAAEMRVWEANRALGDLQGRRETCRTSLEQVQERWSAAVSAPAIQLSIARAYGWRASLLQGDLGRIDWDIAAAENHKAALTQELSRCFARLEAAEELELHARKRAGRLREEALLSDVSDQHAARGTTP